jgi:OOP family OmpA-OmpF porin
MRQGSFKFATVAALLLMAASVANAGFYVGGSLGQTSSDSGSLSEISGPGVSVDDSDTGFKVFGGYNVMKYFSVEAAYVDVTGPGFEMTGSEPVTMTTSADGFAVEAVGVMPVGAKMQFFAELGFFLWDGSAEISSPSFSASGDSGDGTDPTYGVGFGWNVIPKGQIRVEAERYAIGLADQDMDLDMYSAGFAYRF